MQPKKDPDFFKQQKQDAQKIFMFVMTILFMITLKLK